MLISKERNVLSKTVTNIIRGSADSISTEQIQAWEVLPQSPSQHHVSLGQDWPLPQDPITKRPHWNLLTPTPISSTAKTTGLRTQPK